MPVYEYQCGFCGDFEVSQRITEAPLTECPECGEQAKRLISKTHFILLGDGWTPTGGGK